MSSKILFVCLGNICRSPAAEAIAKSFNIIPPNFIDSAATSSTHRGQNADSRMIEAASVRGHLVTSRSRPFNRNKDFLQFDYIVAMDHLNYRDLKSFDITGEHHHKIYEIKNYITSVSIQGIPDPYYGGPGGFDQVITLLEEGVKNFISEMS